MAKKARSLSNTATDPSALAFLEGGPGTERDALKSKMGRPKKKRKVGLTKGTFYIHPDHLLMLDKVRIKRIEAGAARGEVDKSSLVREAIEILAKQHKI